MNQKKSIVAFLIILFNLAGIFKLYSQDTIYCQTVFIDSIKYISQTKTSNNTAISINTINDNGNYGYAGYGQRFEAPDSVKVLGFCFRGFVFSGSAGDTVVCKLFKADGSGMPGTLIDSKIYSVPLISSYNGSMDSDQIKQCVTFGAGHWIEGDYILTIENFATSDMYVARNTSGDGAAENLSYYYYRGVTDPQYNGWYACYPLGSSWDFDMDFEPNIEYTIDHWMTILNDTICLEDSAKISSWVNFDDSIFYNKMYNPNFASYTGYSLTTDYNYGDGTNDGTGIHEYSLGLIDKIVTTNTLNVDSWLNGSFSVACEDSIVVNSVDVGVTQSASLLSANLSGATYQWINCLGMTPIDGATSQSFNANANGDYAVIVAGNNCTDTSTCYTVTGIGVGITENDFGNSLLIYPNPTDGNFSIELGNIYETTIITITDISGRAIQTESYNKSQLLNLKIDGPAGVYLLMIESGNKKAVIRLLKALS